MLVGSNDACSGGEGLLVTSLCARGPSRVQVPPFCECLWRVTNTGECCATAWPCAVECAVGVAVPTKKSRGGWFRGWWVGVSPPLGVLQSLLSFINALFTFVSCLVVSVLIDGEHGHGAVAVLRVQSC